MKTYESIEKLHDLQQKGLSKKALLSFAIETAKTARTSYELKQATNFIKTLKRG